MSGFPGGGPNGPGTRWDALHAEPNVLRILRPTDGSLVGELAVTPSHEVPDRIARTRSVQAGWASLPAKDRTRRLRSLLEAIDQRTVEIEDTVVAETGKPRAEATMEVAAVVEYLRYLLKTTGPFFKPKKISTDWMVWKRAFVQREPLGVIGVIAPWNYPFILSMTPTLAAIFGGNGVVLKPSEFTPYSGLLVEDLARDAGLPDDLVQVVIGGGSTGEALVRGGTDKIFFTGGSGTGRKILAAAAENLTPVVLELGGKDPAIVLEDADVERAARGIAWAGLLNAGQSCISVERVFVADEIYDLFLRELLTQVHKVKAGAGADSDMGPMTTSAQLGWVEKQIADAVDRGATVVMGGERVDPAANVLQPTVLTELDPDSSILTEETFGPVLPVVRVKDAEDAIERSNAVPLALSASVWTRSKERGIAVARRLRAGAVCVNDVIVHFAVPGLPFGGVGESGFGRSHGREGLEEMTRTRSILVDRVGLEKEPWWYPYDRKTRRVLTGTLLARVRGGVGGAFSGLMHVLTGKKPR